MSRIIRTYTRLSRLPTFEERFKYLSLHGAVCELTFGHARWLNQDFYTSREWRQARSQVIARDTGCDLGVQGYEIFDRPIIHHMNPVTIEDLTEGNPDVLDPEYLITTTHRTHNAIHYGDVAHLPKQHVERSPGDTKLW